MEIFIVTVFTAEMLLPHGIKMATAAAWASIRA